MKKELDDKRISHMKYLLDQLIAGLDISINAEIKEDGEIGMSSVDWSRSDLINAIEFEINFANNIVKEKNKLDEVVYKKIADLSDDFSLANEDDAWNFPLDFYCPCCGSYMVIPRAIDFEFKCAFDSREFGCGQTYKIFRAGLLCVDKSKIGDEGENAVVALPYLSKNDPKLIIGI